MSCAARIRRVTTTTHNGMKWPGRTRRLQKRTAVMLWFKSRPWPLSRHLNPLNTIPRKRSLPRRHAPRGFLESLLI
ncbi:hypothetical protein AUP68_02112 [Ilyonectria robusta]